jgi:hypothetical protein
VQLSAANALLRAVAQTPIGPERSTERAAVS